MARILIADAEPTSLLELTSHLTDRGHIVATAESLKEVKEKSQWLLPHICICDFQLDDGTTAPVIGDELRRMAPATEFIVCTSRPLEFVITLCEAVGMRGHYFKKPCDPETLLWVVEGVVCNMHLAKPNGERSPAKGSQRLRAGEIRGEIVATEKAGNLSAH